MYYSTLSMKVSSLPSNLWIQKILPTLSTLPNQYPVVERRQLIYKKYSREKNGTHKAVLLIILHNRNKEGKILWLDLDSLCLVHCSLRFHAPTSGKLPCLLSSSATSKVSFLHMPFFFWHCLVFPDCFLCSSNSQKLVR